MRVLGLMSGTSVDGIDGAIAEIQGYGEQISVTVLGGETVDYPPLLRRAILQLCAGEPVTLAELAHIDDQVAHCFATAAQVLEEHYGPVDLIASHGQTVFHRPAQGNTLGYSLQLGRGAAIAAQSQRPTISNFRAADIAAGGQGAPLVPPVDRVLLSHPHQGRCIQNLGGIGNVTYLPPWNRRGEPTQAVLGWDTGPGNSLLDVAVQDLSGGQRSFDDDGQWAAQGRADLALVQEWLQATYFQQPPPKSTGRERFGWSFWAQWAPVMAQRGLSPADQLATLTEFTAAAIAQEYQRWLPLPVKEILLCGGGTRNQTLRQRLAYHLPSATLTTTDSLGIPSDLKEAIAFAVLGYWRYQGFPGNLPSVTGAQHSTLLGEIYHPCLANEGVRV